ncbi:hypothetical protein GTQ99_00570 [Kineococcus sp. T13]|uniref:helix-turn-helix domain-containing protein n=1 Tax=Kineococcus vitellinus TaxID=2696565 RepID=UPI0014125F42|nr:hypothetical protein [Kineococcus vitellinus]
MSIGCMIGVFHNSKSTGNDRLILLAIADEANDDGGNAFPSMRRLALKANCNKDTVVEAIRRLEALGELEVKRPTSRGPGQYNQYRVLVGLYGNPGQPSGSVKEGSVEGSVRTRPDNSRPNPYNSGKASRTTTASEPSPARFQPPREGCDQCAGGWRLDDDGNAVACGCEKGVHA